MYEMNIRQLIDLSWIRNFAGNIKNEIGCATKNHSRYQSIVDELYFFLTIFAFVQFLALEHQ